MSNLQTRADQLAALMKLSYVGMLAVLTISTWFVVQEGRQPSVTIYVIRLLPLLIFARVVFVPNLRGLAWLCFVCLGYFVGAVTESMSPLARWPDYVQLGLSVSLFISAMVFIRVQSKAWQQAGNAQLVTEESPQ
ncbi:DUF2069 domain-containing protein [Spongiibacter sp. KMU-158]|uniref:DUF2069 domain-containing protein n=1 Tax=Spongiibacter pelagi TaxID=2760804 RepID=A0A927BZW8_9GAMM|nr:DUF2069 domain-containing protein [Spongiibacter pelagi]MBD2858673.1 DUF2069 domain-containing protein [Spongiibacter pelagi]